MNDKILQEIDRIVEQYPYQHIKEVFRAELERLAMIANKEGYLECAEVAKGIFNK